MSSSYLFHHKETNKFFSVKYILQPIFDDLGTRSHLWENAVLTSAIYELWPVPASPAALINMPGHPDFQWTDRRADCQGLQVPFIPTANKVSSQSLHGPRLQEQTGELQQEIER
jgi:hypothetical protein